MIKALKIKDPIFGYITINDDDLYTVINSAMFHRLQDIVQTSYQSVYPSATHNRFSHSLGVYHLGKIAADKITEDIIHQKLCKEEDVKRLKKTFILACLMHDLGHSPFSHTGEKFYFQVKEKDSTLPKIWCLLLKQLNDEEFINDSDGKNKPKGAEHEIMSAYVSLVYYPSIFKELDKSFFVRCIIGLKYSNKKDPRNCYIELLNSKTIDVDKLDYLIRDSFFTGFKSILIDYDRLLKSICIISDDISLSLGFEKSALSTLENVILSHDMERKWIQSHPVIKYECYLVSYMISKTQEYYKDKGIDLFSAESLSENGIGNDDLKICLLSDSDIISYTKRLYSDDPIIKEYYSRKDRRKSLWKSESEYRIFFEQRGVTLDILENLESRINSLETLLIPEFNIPIINDKSLEFLESELNSIPELVRAKKEDELNKCIDFIKVIKSYSEENKVPFDYLLVSAKQFNTGFNKDEFKSIKVRFDNNIIKSLEQVIYLFSAKKPNENFFYLFSKNTSKKIIDSYELTFRLVDFILHEHNK